MNVEIGTEATQFPEKKYINVIFLAVRHLDKKQPLHQDLATPQNRVVSSHLTKKGTTWSGFSSQGPATLDYSHPDSVIRTHDSDIVIWIETVGGFSSSQDPKSG
jgi:hypothetical protein